MFITFLTQPEALLKGQAGPACRKEQQNLELRAQKNRMAPSGVQGLFRVSGFGA